MTALYYLLRIVLSVLHFLVRWRVSRLEARFSRLAADADSLVKLQYSLGGSARLIDACETAKNQYALARLVTRRDRCEEKYASWEAMSDRLGSWRAGMAGYRGRTLPVLVGAADMALLLVGGQHLAAACGIDPEALAQATTDWATATLNSGWDVARNEVTASRALTAASGAGTAIIGAGVALLLRRKDKGGQA